MNVAQDTRERYQLLVKMSMARLPDELEVALWPPAVVEAWLRCAQALYADFDSGEVAHTSTSSQSLRVLLEGLDRWSALVEPYCTHPEEDHDFGEWVDTKTDTSQVVVETREVYCTLCNNTVIDYQERDPGGL